MTSMTHIRLDVTFPKEKEPDSVKEGIIKKIFGLSSGKSERKLFQGVSLPSSGLVYITGYSGAGKSSLLREVSRVLQPTPLKSPNDCLGLTVIEAFEGTVSEGIQWLSRFGLGEARVLTTKVESLSVGQRERFRLAYLLWQKPSVLILDEFLSALDRTTARIIAFQFQKLVRKLGVRCFVATAHDDLKDALFPDAVVELDLEGEPKVTFRSDDSRSPSLAESEEVIFGEGTLEDYLKLKAYHYMEGQTGELNPNDVLYVAKAEFRGKVVGVRVLTKPFPSRFEKFSFFKQINTEAAICSRVVVHPVFRGLNISRRMTIPPTHPKLKTVRKIFTHSALALYFPFDVSSGFREIPHVSVKKTKDHFFLEDKLREYGVGDVNEINDPIQCQAVWNSLKSAEQEVLIEAASNVLSDYDLRNTLHMCDELKIAVSTQSEMKLRQLFRLLVSQTSRSESWRLLSEALHFPMQGLVKDMH